MTPTDTQIEHLIQTVVDRTVASAITRQVDHITEEIILDILRESRAEFTKLINAAITQALANLREPPAADGGAAGGTP